MTSTRPLYRSMLCAALVVLTAITSYSQVSEGGVPLSHDNPKLDWQAPELRMPAIDENALLAEDDINNRNKDVPYRFGYNFEPDVTLENAGVWHKLPSGDRVWRLALRSDGARSLNVTFDQFFLPEGAKLFIFSPDYTHVLGAFTTANNHPDGGFGTYPIPGDAIVLEYFEPRTHIGQGKLSVEYLTHAYRDLDLIARGIGDSGLCNNNVVCALGDDWRDQIDAVAMIVVNGNGICTGSLINNTANDGHPYFLTADHCLGGNVSNWVYRFNFQSTTCQGNNVGTFQTVSGSTLLASGASADYALLRINNGSPVPQDYNPFYAGWDASGANPSSQVGIHHPSGDLKKISFDNDPAGTATFLGAICWHIFNWENGTTEPGSSGSPLFDQNKRIIGQLYGGQATCTNNVNDYYGKFNVTYPNICQWIAPSCNTLVLDGYSPSASSFANDVRLDNVVSPSGVLCGSTVSPEVVIRNLGSNPVTSLTIAYGVDGSYPFSFNFTGNIQPGTSTTVSLPSFTPGAGSYQFVVNLIDPNGIADEDPSNNLGASNFELVPDGVDLFFTLTTDNYPGETTWEIVNAANVVMFSDGPYAQTQTTFTYDFCLPAGCYTLNVYDSFGDGLQFGGVVGNYTLTDGDGSVLAQMVAGGNFGSLAVHNFCLTATIIEGCTNPQACNYAAAAGVDDGSCDLESCLGCTNPLAENYDPSATIDNGSCELNCTPVTIELSTDCWGAEVAWTLTDSLGAVLESVAAGSLANAQTYTYEFCLTDGCYNFTITDTFGDGMFGSQWDGCSIDGNYTITNASGAVLVQMVDPNYGFGITETFCVEGFSEPVLCLGDLNLDGQIDVSDILILLTNFGCSNACIGDLDGDGQVTAADFLIMLSLFGTICP